MFTIIYVLTFVNLRILYHENGVFASFMLTLVIYNYLSIW